jgi:hypothetical protein
MRSPHISAISQAYRAMDFEGLLTILGEGSLARPHAHWGNWMTELKDEAGKVVNASEVIAMLIQSGFTRDQAIGLTNVILGIRLGTLTVEDAEETLERFGFADNTAHKLSELAFRMLAAA